MAKDGNCHGIDVGCTWNKQHYFENKRGIIKNDIEAKLYTLGCSKINFVL